MSADLLREAAALMRERAEAATEGPWQAVEGASGGWWIECPYTATIAEIDVDHSTPAVDAEHIASWHPAVALAVADWLYKEATWADIGAANSPDDEALAVARAYLGRAS